VFTELVIIGKFVFKDFDSDITIKPVTQSLVNNGHATGTYYLEYFISVVEQRTQIPVHAIFH